MFRQSCLAALAVFTIAGNSAQAMTIVINPNGTLSANAPALAAFQRAANAWANVFSDPITVNINAGLSSLGAGIIGSTNSLLLAGGYTTVRNGMVADAVGEVGNGIVASLPTAAQVLFQVPGGFSLDGSVVLTQANAKALGLVNPVTGLSGAADGTITFSTNFTFDFDNSDGVGAGLVDFETVAAHEIGHALGFVSAVDFFDGATPAAMPIMPLDLFRFSAANLPGNAAQFTTNARSLVPGANASFSDTVNVWRFSTGLTQGDGNQASHWKDDALTGSLIGIMDPTLSSGFVSPITFADIRAFDLIGYDVAIPEPATFALVGVALVVVIARRRTTQL